MIYIPLLALTPDIQLARHQTMRRGFEFLIQHGFSDSQRKMRVRHPAMKSRVPRTIQASLVAPKDTQMSATALINIAQLALNPMLRPKKVAQS